MSENYDIIDEVDDKKTSGIKSGLRFARFVMLLMMAVCALILLFVNRDKINMDNLKRLLAKFDMGVSNVETSDNAVIDFDYDSTGTIDVYKDGLARVTSDNLVIMDNMGTQFQSMLTGYNNPAIITTDKYVLVYDRGGTRLAVTNSFTVLFETIFDDNIVYVSMNESGYFVVITESVAYKNKLTVFNSNFKEIYKINSLNRYLLCADISPDNNKIIVSSLYVKDSNSIPQLNCYKLNSEDSLWDVNYADNVAVNVVCKYDGSYAALYEWGISIVDSKGNEKYKYEFGNRILQNYYIDQGKNNIVIMSDSISGNSELLAFNNNGKTISTINFDNNVLSIDIMGDRISVLTRDEVLLYSISGKLISKRENSNDGTKVLFSDKNSVLSISASSAVYNVLD